ncbi:MAG: glycoside hydrolase family 88 protein [Clostridia bacterium]|nr:glycoside hydrolase family 88 protein [Clostridia bacterium]
MEQWMQDALQKTIDKFRKGASIAAKQGILPYTGENGRFGPAPFDGNSWWTGGFWPGIMWQCYNATKEECFLQEALRAEEMLVAEIAAFEKLHHDVGFMYLLSCGAHDRLIGDTAARTHTLHAANLLAGRFNPEGFIRAWNGEDHIGYAIVDCMMNLPLLHWAAKQTGDPRYTKIARIHADTTIREFQRPDGSCCHICIFDPESGKVLQRPRGQGYKEGSSWSRGQAWALYGFTLSALNLKDDTYLAAAKRCADYFIAHIRPDGLTCCDFCQPDEPELIDNIAGACAACGLIELAKLTGEEKYHASALKLLYGLHTLCADYSDRCTGVLQKCTAAYHNDGAGRHINILYGDYFYLEALCKLAGHDARLWMCE